MGALRIPKEHQEVIQDYIRLSDEQKHEIVSAIRNAEIGLIPSTLASMIEKKLQIPDVSVADIIQVLLNLQSTQRNLAEDEEDFLELLRNTYEKLDKPEFSPDEFLESLSLLLSASGDNATATGRVLEIINDNQNVFIDCSLNNDIRPVFLDETDDIKGVVLVHHLKIEYRTSDESKEMYFALDSDDLKKLKDAIKLAEKQSKALESVVNRPFINIK